MNKIEIVCLFCLSLSISLSACKKEKEYPHNHLQVMDIINKTSEEVTKTLGEPDSAFIQKVVTKKFYTQLYYDLDSLEIQYMDSTAKDVVVHKPFSLPFNKKILENYGLDLKEPTSNELGEVLRWENYSDFKMISSYVTLKDDDGGISEFKIFFKAK